MHTRQHIPFSCRPLIYSCDTGNTKVIALALVVYEIAAGKTHEPFTQPLVSHLHSAAYSIHSSPVTYSWQLTLELVTIIHCIVYSRCEENPSKAITHPLVIHSHSVAHSIHEPLVSQGYLCIIGNTNVTSSLSIIYSRQAENTRKIGKHWMTRKLPVR